MVKNRLLFRFISMGLLVAIFMSLVVGCSSQAPTTSPDQPKEAAKPKKGGTVTVAFQNEPDTLDAHTSSGSDQTVNFNLGGSLLYLDPVTQEFKPNLAEAYKVSEDGKTITFTMRSGITFSDGTPMTAKTFKETFDRALDPKTNAKMARIFLDGVTSVKAPDDKTLILELNGPIASLLTNLSFPVLQPLSMKAIEKYGKDYGRNPVGVGPWKFDSWQSGQSVTLVRNEAATWAPPIFENQGPPNPDKLVLKFIADKQTMMAALDSGAIDLAYDVPAKDIKKYKNNPKYQVLEVLGTGISLMVEMNMRNEILQDVQVRKAINMLVNKEAIIQSVLHGEGVAVNGPLPPTILGYDKAVEEYGYKYYPDEAKKLLDAAGWKANAEGVREKNGKVLSLNLLSSDRWNKDSQLIQSMLGEAGIKVTIQNMEDVAQTEASMKGNFDLLMTTYFYPDPDIFFPFFHSSQIGAYNFAGIKDEKLDEYIMKGHTTYDTDARKKVYAEAQKHMVEQAYIVPVYTAKQFSVVSTRVKGVKLIAGIPNFNDSWVDQ